MAGGGGDWWWCWMVLVVVVTDGGGGMLNPTSLEITKQRSKVGQVDQAA